jgi:putative endonuclease
MTDNLQRRVHEHKNKIFKNAFSARYNTDKLVYYEVFADNQQAAYREKELKGWLREKKITLVEAVNPQWEDLSNLVGKEVDRSRVQEV